jgi:hypothetical protein
MKKTLLLTFFGSLCVSVTLLAQLPVSIVNNSFELPENGQKITNMNNVPGWHCDTVRDCGRESNAAIHGLMAAYTDSWDGSFYQAVDVIGDTNVTYVLRYSASISWTPEANDTCYIKSYFSAFSGSDPTTRIVLDSMVSVYSRADIFEQWKDLTHEFTIPAGSTNVGDSLVIEFNISSKADLESWGNFDFIRLTKYYEEGGGSIPVQNVILAPYITGPADYSMELTPSWDADSVYLTFDVTDDSVVISPVEIWLGDNIELYFDMDNSKNALWPRTALGRPSAYDANDYQFRLVPRTPWEAYNTKQGVKMDYNEFDGGYQFYVRIPWDSLMHGFDAKIGNVIGFDIYASDNDNDPFNRDMISLYTTNGALWDDPSFFGTVELGAYGQFIHIPDDMPPSVPTGLDTVSTGGTWLTLIWNASIDQQSEVLLYSIYQDDALISTIYAQDPVSNTFHVTGLTPGNTYSFSIVAVDNFFNYTDFLTSPHLEVTTKLPTQVSIDETNNTLGSIYPNPAMDKVNIVSASLEPVSFEIYNTTGNLIHSGIFTGSTLIDLSSIDAGIYLITLKSEERVQVEKLIIR